MLTGRLESNASQNFHLFDTLMSWADQHRTLKIRTNADTPEMAEQAMKLGAEGIGLCRTEHMFFAEDRIDHMRKMILAATEEQPREALAEFFLSSVEIFLAYSGQWLDGQSPFDYLPHL
ncbi:MAG: hypothetical protein CM1200mP9_05560 [Gammaproteobacteria bacterium]|nr:MAG: hypothetical protein CM1200mP9_05560 [Gammaproteobacteria bacterium]